MRHTLQIYLPLHAAISVHFPYLLRHFFVFPVQVATRGFLLAKREATALFASMPDEMSAKKQFLAVTGPLSTKVARHAQSQRGLGRRAAAELLGGE